METLTDDAVLGEIKHVETDFENLWQGAVTVNGFDAPVRFEFDGAEIESPEDALGLLRDFAQNAERYLQDATHALHDFLVEHGEVFGLGESELETFSQMNVHELRGILNEPLAKVLSDDEGELAFNLGFYDCPLDGEGGVGFLFRGGQISEVTSAAGELGMYAA
jgi:hypothetical protein